MALVAADTRSWIKRQLGDPTVVVELTDDQLDDAIAEALGVVSTTIPRIRRTQIQGAVGVMKYSIPGGSYGRGLVDVEVEPTYLTGNHIDIFNPQDVALALRQASSGYVDFAMALGDVEAAKAVLSSDFDWEFEAGADPAVDAGTLFVSPEPASAQVYTLVYTENWTTGTIPQSYHGWVQRYALARSKVTLGMIRRKFGSVQGAQTTLETDGAQLVSEGSEEMRSLVESLSSRKSALFTPITGI